MQCILLCAGYGTRLAPLTDDCPKPLLPVGGVPLLERTMERVLEIPALEKVWVVSNHRFADRFASWSAAYASEAGGVPPIEVVDDGTTSNQERLGAIGDLELALRRVPRGTDLLVLAGDNLVLFSLDEFCRFGRAKRLATAVKDLKNRRNASLYGVVRLDREGRVTEFVEKPREPASSLISVGVYFFGGEHVPAVAEYVAAGGPRDRMGDLVGWLSRSRALYGWVIRGQWFDIGDLASYEEANRLFGV